MTTPVQVYRCTGTIQGWYCVRWSGMLTEDKWA